MDKKSFSGWPLINPPFTVQTAAIEACNYRRGFAYLMEMGLGKTAVALAEFVSLTRADKCDGLIVVCPNSLKHNWINEAKKFVSDDIRYAAWPEIPARGSDPFIQTINYEAFSVGGAKGDSMIRSVMESRYRTMLVLDESTHIRNWNGQRTKRLIALSTLADYRRVLTGAPVVRGPHDFWAQLRVIGATVSNPYQFRNTYCVMGGYKRKQFIGPKNMDKLDKLLAQWCFRARKDEWTDLPPKSWVTRDLKLGPDQQKSYKEMLREFYTIIESVHGDPTDIEVDLIITQMMKLQQISSGFIIDGDKVVHRFKSNPKVDLLIDTLREINTKVIVFAFFTESINMIREACESNGIKTAVIRGGMQDTVEAEKSKFNEGDATVLVNQQTTGKYGHTLLGTIEQPCHTSIFYENTYDLDTRIQCEDRNHRHGQRNPVLYIDFIASPSDRCAIEALQRKKSVADAVVDAIKRDEL